MLVVEQVIFWQFQEMTAYVFIWEDCNYIDFQLFGHFSPSVTYDVDILF